MAAKGLTKYRLIATLLCREGKVVQTRKFQPTNVVGNPFTAVDFFNSWAVDEIAILEISKTSDHVDMFVELVEDLSRRCFVPLTVGGKITNIALVHRYVRAGADKVVINTALAERPELITEVSTAYGRQATVVSIDARANRECVSGYEVLFGRGKIAAGLDVEAWAKEAVERGAGEILLNSVAHDGDKRGYDIPLVQAVSKAVDVPVIAFGGVGEWRHLLEGIEQGGADAVAAGNIFHYSEHSTKKAKEYLEENGIHVRKSVFYDVNMPRLPNYRP